MATVTISTKFQVVIPREIRDALGLIPGQRVQALRFGDRIELIPIRPVTALRGMLRGIDTTVDRDDDRV
jgi:AbrB family looped-hinge helix DNA binding protein